MLTNAVKTAKMIEKINAVHIRRFTYTLWDANATDSGSMDIEYVLGFRDTTGFTPSSNNNYHQHITLINLEGEFALKKFLQESGVNGNDDLHQFDYHDILRLVRADVKEKFGIEV